MCKQVRIFIVLIYILFSPQIFSQTEKSNFSFYLSADFLSSYVWRGAVLQGRPVIQPFGSFNYKNIELSVLGSQNLVTSGSSFVTYLAYHIKTPIGTFSPMFVDFYPSLLSSTDPENHFFNYKTNGFGAHVLETNITYEGTKKFPLRIFASVDVYNDPEKAAYLEVGYRFPISEYNCILYVGTLLSEKSAWYASDPSKPIRRGVNNIGFTATKDLILSESFKIPFRGTFTVNPAEKRAIFVFGFRVE
ncbi:MAG: hypothetical protein KF721_01340 [Ignavibacteriaceae bacterium]|nr:hypothetical protein [Ignavibacteriaceae bacterium]